MSRIAFIGLGHMGRPMVENLIKAGHELQIYDVVTQALASFRGKAKIADNLQEVVDGADVVISMLPMGEHVQAVYLGKDGILQWVNRDSLLIDSSTIDVVTARLVQEAAGERGIAMLDAPVSGGTAGAEQGILTFMVGGEKATFERAQPILSVMGKNIIHAGPSGCGQAAKICNNMILGVSMIAVCEAFNLAKGLGLSQQAMFDICSKASAACWSLTTYCPVPGPVPTSPANREYAAGFTAAMMLKDLRLAQDVAADAKVETPLGEHAKALYEIFCDAGKEQMDFSGIINLLKEMKRE